MSTNHSRNARRLAAAGVALAALTPVGAAVAGDRVDEPQLTGRAVLPVETYSDGPPAGSAVPNAMNDPDGDKIINGIKFPTPSQPVEGFSGIVEGRRRGEFLMMADNGFGNKANSFDFHIRAYYVQPDFKTADGGSGGIAVRDHIEFSDPDGHFPFAIQHEGTAERVLTGADIDPESIQRDRRGDLWVGDEFGPWLLHFDEEGRLLEAPVSMPDGLVAATNPATVPDADPNTPDVPITVSPSRGIEAMAMTPNGRTLVVILEGATLITGDAPTSRRIYEFNLHHRTWTRAADYVTGAAGNFVADAQALDSHHLLVVERDGAAAVARNVYEIDLRMAEAGGVLPKMPVVNLAAIPDPDLVSLPAIHTGDIGLATAAGDPFRVVCESIEALRILSTRQLLLGCDNNFPNKARNPDLADDNELITVAVPKL